MTTPTLTRTRITTPTQWAVQVLVDMNKKLPKNQQIPINVKNVETILRPISGETNGQQGGIFRDNNPWNIGGDVTQPHAVWSGNGVPNLAALGGHINSTLYPNTYLTQFPTPEAGAQAAAEYMLMFGNYKAMRLSAPASIVYRGTSYVGEAGDPPAETPSQPQIDRIAATAGSDVGSPTLTHGQAKNLEQWLTGLAPLYKSATGQTLNVPTTSTLETWTEDQAVAEVQRVFGPIQKGTGNSVPGRSLIVATIGQGGASTAGAATPESDLIPSIGAPSWVGELGKLLGDLTQSAFWKRIGVFALGGALVIGGIVVFLQSTKPVQAAEGALPHA